MRLITSSSLYVILMSYLSVFVCVLWVSLYWLGDSGYLDDSLPPWCLLSPPRSLAVGYA